MAYMCADSGNLMAIAQQVIKQQQQLHQFQPEHHLQSSNPQNPTQFLGPNNNPFFLSPCPTSVPPLSSTSPPPPPLPFLDPFYVGGPPSVPSDTWQLDVHHLHHSSSTTFRFSDFCCGASGEFDLDEWMESLMSSAPPHDSAGAAGVANDSSTTLQSPVDAWQSSDLSLFGADPFATCPPRINVTISPPSDLSRVIYSHDTNPQDNKTVGNWAPPPSPPLKDPPTQPNPKDAVNNLQQQQEEWPPSITALLDCARLSESDQTEPLNH